MGGLWLTRWARCRIGSGEILARHPQSVTAVATVVLPDGRPVAVTSGADTTVRIWDLTSAAPVGEPLTGHTDVVRAVATAVLPDGRPVAVTGGADTTVRIWDLTSAAPVGEPLTGHTGAVRAVATAVLPDGRPVAITGSDDDTVRIWDLEQMAMDGQPIRIPDRLMALAVQAMSTSVYITLVGPGMIVIDFPRNAI
ncbi:hypothetical protein [Geodermatophilus amargosae]|uniref:hypothetical protein n=1 Tax=Geodermatophilus amargosae TaxID=1296565 RepID=UPI000B83B74F|nr:hypothetical protein [Geodermatophilus amargosae]